VRPLRLGPAHHRLVDRPKPAHQSAGRRAGEPAADALRWRGPSGRPGRPPPLGRRRRSPPAWKRGVSLAGRAPPVLADPAFTNPLLVHMHALLTVTGAEGPPQGRRSGSASWARCWPASSTGGPPPSPRACPLSVPNDDAGSCISMRKPNALISAEPVDTERAERPVRWPGLAVGENAPTAPNG
jgi:hypothetical protein